MFSVASYAAKENTKKDSNVAAGCQRCALAVHLLHGESSWNHQAFFDYVDRWMTEDDAQAVAEIKAQSGYDYSANWERQGQSQDWLGGEVSQPSFIDDMWNAYHW